jgi:hypothetical protein
MMETKHSPGPWRAQRVGQYGPWHIVAATPGYFAEITGACDGAHGKTADANARLIAAAPELLAACEIMRDRLMRFPSRAWAALTSEESIAFNRALDTAVDVIQRATGDE